MPMAVGFIYHTKLGETALSALHATMTAIISACRVFPKGSKLRKNVTKGNNLLFVVRATLS